MQNKLDFTEAFNHKIIKDLDLFIQTYRTNKAEKLVMCHGTFDLVHPGHIRHLLYAKSKGDVLVVSITSDSFVFKANSRPYVPEELRLINLAALEFVDFVIIDNQETPIELISRIKPDIFVKGFEYGQNGEINPKSLEEKNIVESTGGEYLFSPGDFVMSSSKIIETEPPKIGFEKLQLLMKIEKINFEDIYETLSQFSSKSVCLVGDLIIDSLTESTVIGGHRKTPTPSVAVLEEQFYVGGAGIVAKHMAATGARVLFSTLLGDDELSKYAEKDLIDQGVELNIVRDSNRPTTHKKTIMADGYKLVRMDWVNNSIINDEQFEKLARVLNNNLYDAVCFSDFRHGIFNKQTIPKFVALMPENVVKVADSQVASRWGNILDFQNFDLITPNEQEVRFSMGDQDTVIRPLASTLYDRANCKVLILKLGSRGTMTFRNPELDQVRRSFFSIDSLHLNSIVDPVGAGDALLSYASLSYSINKNEVISSILGNIAAGLACEVEGNVPIQFDHLLKRVKEIETVIKGN